MENPAGQKFVVSTKQLPRVFIKSHSILYWVTTAVVTGNKFKYITAIIVIR